MGHHIASFVGELHKSFFAPPEKSAFPQKTVPLTERLRYRVTRRVFSKPVTSKLHLLYKKNLAGHLKTPKVTRISAMYTNFSHSPVHSGLIYFYRTKNKTNKILIDYIRTLIDTFKLRVYGPKIPAVPA